jgi:hypothetical protein
MQVNSFLPGLNDEKKRYFDEPALSACADQIAGPFQNPKPVIAAGKRGSLAGRAVCKRLASTHKAGGDAFFLPDFCSSAFFSQREHHALALLPFSRRWFPSLLCAHRELFEKSYFSRTRSQRIVNDLH